ncbi:unnamed protein product [Acanthosepion pharaonis]|uniref:Uncharacterized protein n=1 Tax=Acanthosepion pharaonis TaxID=158019 RepID=A0A812BDH9_ACAPH|nr:unnamed protein product [Sepia pharaonis]
MIHKDISLSVPSIEPLTPYAKALPQTPIPSHLPLPSVTIKDKSLLPTFDPFIHRYIPHYYSFLPITIYFSSPGRSFSLCHLSDFLSASSSRIFPPLLFIIRLSFSFLRYAFRLFLHLKFLYHRPKSQTRANRHCPPFLLTINPSVSSSALFFAHSFISTSRSKTERGTGAPIPLIVTR